MSDNRFIFSGRPVTYMHYGQVKTDTVERLGSDGSIVFLTNGRWLHRITAKIHEVIGPHSPWPCEMGEDGPIVDLN
jgi:hypothetical protein